jgi:DNA-binding beta-propeller fold protein YncE
VPALDQPTNPYRCPSGHIIFGSTSTAQNKFVAFTDPGSGLVHDAPNDVNLSDNGKTGNQPRRCAVYPGSMYLYCTAGGGSDGGGIWKFMMGTMGQAKLLVSGLSNPNAIAISPNTRLMAVATNGLLQTYWIGGDRVDAPSPLQTVTTGGDVTDVTFSSDGSYIYAAVGSQNKILKVRAADLAVVKSFDNLAGPNAFNFIP